MAAAKDCHVLISYFMKKYKEKYKVEPAVNRHSARWGFDSVLMDLSVQDVKGLMDYYFTTDSTKRHSLDWFLYNYEKLIEAMTEQLRDAQRRAKLRKESEERAKEWRERGKQGIAND